MKRFCIIVGVCSSISLYAITLIGHRGACGYAPENTLSSFAKAIECDVDMIELDVRVCATGELVVMHDPKVDRITNGSGSVAALSLHELQGLIVMGSERIVTLEEVLQFIDRRVRVYIELKDAHAGPRVVALIEQYVHLHGWQYGDFMVASFDHQQLFDIKRLNKNIATIALVYGIPSCGASCMARLNVDVVCVDEEFVTQQFVTDIHSHGITVYVYTINDKNDLERVLDYGVEGIITDFPASIK